jgi:ribosomal protein L13E
LRNKFIIMHSQDNCATSLIDIPKDELVSIKETNTIKINQNIPLGHKFALNDIYKGDLIKKYGEIIGIATRDIKKGDWVHTHNIKSHYLEEIKK